MTNLAVVKRRSSGGIGPIYSKKWRATRLEPAASCVAGRRSNLGEAVCANVGQDYRGRRCKSLGQPDEEAQEAVH
jgi:hypothetical protein